MEDLQKFYNIEKDRGAGDREIKVKSQTENEKNSK
jgi:hypothetical protein